MYTNFRNAQNLAELKYKLHLGLNMYLYSYYKSNK